MTPNQGLFRTCEALFLKIQINLIKVNSILKKIADRGKPTEFILENHLKDLMVDAVWLWHSIINNINCDKELFYVKRTKSIKKSWVAIDTTNKVTFNHYEMTALWGM